MTFELLPDLAPFLTAYVVLAALAVLLAVVAAAGFVVTHRRERLARHESVATYYGQLHFAH